MTLGCPRRSGRIGPQARIDFQRREAASQAGLALREVVFEEVSEPAGRPEIHLVDQLRESADPVPHLLDLAPRHAPAGLWRAVAPSPVRCNLARGRPRSGTCAARVRPSRGRLPLHNRVPLAATRRAVRRASRRRGEFPDRRRPGPRRGYRHNWSGWRASPGPRRSIERRHFRAWVTAGTGTLRSARPCEAGTGYARRPLRGTVPAPAL